MKVYRWKISRYSLFFLANLVVYLVICAFVIQKGMFIEGESDGFYSQVQHIASGASWSTSPLYLVHLLRFFVVSPFYYVYVNGYSEFFESILILLFLLPVITARFDGRRVLWQVVFIYLPLFFSYRAVLVMCAMSYLFICLYGDKRSYLKLLVSMLLANLSSGVVLPWVIIAFLNSKLLFGRYKFVRPIAMAAIVVLGFSIMHKIGFFFGEHSSGPSLMERNTFYVSIVHEQYLRLLVYLTLLFAWLGIGLCKVKFSTFPDNLYLFYVPAFFTLFFEGLGFVSFLIPIAWFYMAVRPVSTYLKRGSPKGLGRLLGVNWA